MKINKVFIYGTLKSNNHNNPVMKDIGAEYIGNDVTVNCYPLYQDYDPFPYLQNTSGVGYKIKGEIWSVRDDKMYILDRFEGVPDLYVRGEIETEKYGNVFVYYSGKSRDVSKLNMLDEW